MTTFLVFAEDWQRHPSSSQHLMQQIAARHRVIWVNSIGLRSPEFNGRDWHRMWRKGTALFRGQPTVEREATTSPLSAVIAPLCIPFHQYAAIRWFNRQLLQWQIKRCLRKLGIDSAEPVILWLALPSSVCIVGAFAEQSVIYYCGDDFASLAGVDHATMTQLEQQLAAKANHIFCASPLLMQKFPAEKTHLLSHGVDVELFRQQWPRPAALPVAPHIAGFYGLLADWIDVSLLARVAVGCPDWAFVLIGRQQTDVSALQGLANVHLLPEMPHALLVQYACHFHALLLPFKQCQQIDYCNPLKLREYLAIGQPILSVPFPAMQPYASSMFQVHTADEWVACLTTLAQWTETSRQRWQQQSRAMVSDESWQARARDIEARLSQSADDSRPALAWSTQKGVGL